ncbi:MAG: S8 family serine peptidase [Candidatus Schekmanbacteria bacterium]|nr:S8 family serine peptidase [Candidatus Schekmanbacteria bacterium]
MKIRNAAKIAIPIILFMTSCFFHPRIVNAKVKLNACGVFVESGVINKYKKNDRSDVIVVLKNPESIAYSRLTQRAEKLCSRINNNIAKKKRSLEDIEEELKAKYSDESLVKDLKDNKAKLSRKIKKLSGKLKNLEESVSTFSDESEEEMVERILSTLDRKKRTDESLIETKRKFTKIPAFSGILTKRGYRILRKNKDVLIISENKRITPDLDVSVPLINGNDVKAVRINSDYINGTGETVAVIDTGVNYKNSALGGCVPSDLITITAQETYTLDSPHDYPVNYDNSWTITKPGYANIAVYFQKIELQNGSDFIYLLDGDNNIIQTLTGNYNNNFWSHSIPGNTVTIRMISDASVNGFGFNITKVADGITNTEPLNNCQKVIGGYDFISDDYDPFDDNNHGTAVAKIIASEDSVYAGVAPGAKLVALKVMDKSGSGSASDVAAAIEWCIANKSKYGISLINMSFGDGGKYNSSLYCDQFYISQMVNLAVANGIFVSVASGNDGYTNGISLPACASGSTSVGAVYSKDWGSLSWSGSPGCTDSTTDADKITCFTNRNSLLDLLAPGSQIKVSDGGAYYGGTSMAAPHVVGAAALIQQNAKKLDGTAMTPTQIQSKFKSTGVPVTDSATGLTFKRIDAYAALGWTTSCSEYYPVSDTEVSLSGVPFWDSINKVLSGAVDVTNLSSANFYESRIVLYDFSSPSVSVLSPDGYMDVTIDGAPYANVPYYYYGTLTASGSSSVNFRLQNSEISGFAFKVKILAKNCS